MKAKRKTLRELRMGTPVKLKHDGKTYLFNTYEKNNAILYDRGGRAKHVSLSTSVFYIPKEEGAYYFSSFVD